MRPIHFAVLMIAGGISALAQTPSIAAGGILNGASFAKGQPVAAGSLISIFGTNLAAATQKADSVPLSTSLGGVGVTFNGIAAPMVFVSHDAANGDQINAQVPWEVQDGTAQVVVSRGGVASSPASVAIGASPGIFSFALGSNLQAIAYGNSDSAFAAPAGAVAPPFTAHPAKINDPTTLVILATGLGPVNPPVKTGQPALDGQVHNTVTTPQVLVGGVPAKVVFSGMTPEFPGVYQLNIVIQPGTPTGNAVPLQISMNGVTTSNQVVIAVSN